jgi:hypothetical protein
MEEPQYYTAVAEYDFDANEDNELSFKEGDTITVTKMDESGWWLGFLTDETEIGMFPACFVRLATQ